MIVQMDRAGAVSLAEADDFKGFKLVIAGDPAGWASRQAGFGDLARLESDKHAWVSEAGLRALGPQNPEWQGNLTRMIDYARSKGWTEPGTGAIRGHIEWQA